MRGRFFNLSAIGRVAGILAVGAAIVAAAVHFRHSEPRPLAGLAGSASSDPLAQEMARCHVIGMAATSDANCQAAWAENQRRFFNYGASPIPVAPTASINRLATTGAK
ncbi:MAG: putative entry exclusion protein TrbK-alt [Pseudomonadota bacterium]|nr:putative entry exclusion protein TrbK-alt [Pseudomonadota bacterium]